LGGGATGEWPTGTLMLRGSCFAEQRRPHCERAGRPGRFRGGCRTIAWVKQRGRNGVYDQWRPAVAGF